MIERNPNADMRAANRKPNGEASLAATPGSDAAPKIKHVFRLELTRKQAKQLREEWAAHSEDGGMMIMQAGLNFGPFEVKNVAAQCAILTKAGATAVNNAIKPEKHQNTDIRNAALTASDCKQDVQ